MKIREIKKLIREAFEEKQNNREEIDFSKHVDLINSELNKFLQNKNYTKEQFANYVKSISDTFVDDDTVDEELFQGKNNIANYKVAASKSGVKTQDIDKGTKALQSGDSVNVSEASKQNPSKSDLKKNAGVVKKKGGELKVQDELKKVSDELKNNKSLTMDKRKELTKQKKDLEAKLAKYRSM